ncbi:hypothetical protein GUJ93_ZPchr0001g31188 [Zizania palustris]|uniref:RING-type domain-containing protein n=1 Tax=Zizania palustris TaxID=103762 RepID=A0A8J5SFM8_ZIZPA|nr:hypothetical protein GUJ93_ZPchr0001g31188 [Zizania palustris]
MDVVEQLQGRRLLSNGAAAEAAIASRGTAGTGHGVQGGAPRRALFSSLDATVITVLSLLLCVFVVGFVLHAVLRCALRLTRRVCYGQESPVEEETASRPERCAAPASKKKWALGAIGDHTTLVYSPGIKLAGYGSTECAICLAEFAQGERVRVLPRCSHGFHARCIDRWLSAKQTCPTCRREPFANPAPVVASAAVQLQLQVYPDAALQHETP